MSSINGNENNSGKYDPTAARAIAHATREEKRFNMLLGTIFNICEMAGYHLEERIVVKDKRTGRVWR